MANAIVTEAAPSLTPRTWYGMPAYAKDGALKELTAAEEARISDLVKKAVS